MQTMGRVPAADHLNRFPSWTRPVRNVQDQVALEEIELYANVIIAARETQEPLTKAALDRVLGLDQAPV
ncbi:MAG TPA: hypothetical protein VGX23_37175 [Actinocrinis sp.]|nr:hypothetical protein [Actinocrinis sp.]